MTHLFAKIFYGLIIERYISDIKGLENIPKGPFIAAANHASYADDLIIPYVLIKKTNKRVHMFVNSRFYDNWFLRTFLNHYDCIKVDVKKDVADDKKRKLTNDLAFRTALSSLKKGEVVGIFPEGGRSIDGKLKIAKSGIAKVALESGLPILPIGIIGSYDIMPKGSRFPRFRKAKLVIGKPIQIDKYLKREKDFKLMDELTKDIMVQIAKLTDQEYKF